MSFILEFFQVILTIIILLWLAVTLLRLAFWISNGRPRSIRYRFDPSRYREAYTVLGDEFRAVLNPPRGQQPLVIPDEKDL